MMATQMLGYLDVHETSLGEEVLNDLKKMNALKIAENNLKECIDFSSKHDLRVSTDNTNNNLEASLMWSNIIITISLLP